MYWVENKIDIFNDIWKYFIDSMGKKWIITAHILQNINEAEGENNIQ